MENLFKATFAHNLRHLMERDSYSRQDIADRLEIAPQNITYYLQGKGVPKVISLIILRNLFNVSIDDLFFKDLSKQKIREATRSGAETEMLEHLSSVQNALENANQNINGIKNTLVYLIENRKEIK